MKALLLFLSVLICISAQGQEDSLRAAYWEKYWERDYRAMDSIALVNRGAHSNPDDHYSVAMMANAMALFGNTEGAASLIDEHDLLHSTDDDAWMLAAYTMECLIQEAGNTAQLLLHEQEAEEALITRDPGLQELYIFTNTIARSYYERGDPLGALEQIDRLKSHPAFQSNDRVRGRTQEKSAIISWSVGQFSRARKDMEEAIAIHTRLTPEPDFYLAQLTNNLGVICNAQGDLAKAIQLYEIAREYYLAFEGPNSHWVNVSYSNMGKAYHDQGDMVQAEESFRKRQEILESSRGTTPFQRFENAHYTAVVLFEQAKGEQADSCLHRMEDILEQHFPEDGVRRAELHTLRARIALQQNDPPEAIASAHRALASFNTLGVAEAPMLTRSHLVLSRAYEQLAQTDSAHHFAQLALDPYVSTLGDGPRVIRNGKDCFEPLTHLASLLSRNHDSLRAQELFELAFQTLDEERLNLDDAASRRFIYNQASEMYFEYLDHLSRHFSAEDSLLWHAVSTIERAKSFNLRLAQGQRRLRQSGQIPDSLALEQNTLLQAISRLNEKQKSLEDYVMLDELRLQLDSLRERVRKDYPAAFEGQQLLREMTIEEVQERLGKNELYITLLLGEGKHWIGLITKDVIEIRSGTHPGLQKIITEYALAFQNPTSAMDGETGLKEFQRRGHEIYRALFADVQLQGFDHVIFSPSGAFGQLNPGLLITAVGAADYASVSYLIKEVPISTRWTWNTETADEGSNSHMGIFASSPKGVRSIEAAIEEARSIAMLTDGSQFVDDSCTEANFIAHQQNYGLLHLATHGIIDDQPWGTYLEFNPDSASDGQLNLIEIAGLDLHARHITLSTCKSAQSQWQTGEAFGSLAIGFAEAGCPSLTASLWDAPDQSTKEIMINFYEGLSLGLPKSEALRKAQLDYLNTQEDPLKTHPYFWGGFIQIGDDSPLDFGKKGISPWWWLLLLPVALYGIQKFRGSRRTKAA